MELPTTYYENEGEHNRETTLQLVLKETERLPNAKIIIATTSGTTGLRALELFDHKRLIIVTHQAGFKSPFTQELSSEIMEKLHDSGARVLTTGHALAGVGRAIRQKLGTWTYSEILAMAYRVFGQGTKVCIECTLMAADAGLLEPEEVIVVAGTGRGADTAWTILPAHTQGFMDLKMNRLICKPLWEASEIYE